MSDFSIRTPKERESHKLALTFVKSFIKTPTTSEFLERLTRIFKLGISREIFNFIIAENDSEFIGMGGEVRHAGVSYIGYLGVIPQFRNHGIGSTLFETLVKQSLNYNQTIELFSNLGVENLYRKLDFEDDSYFDVANLTVNHKKTESDVIVDKGIIPHWIFDLDRKVMGFNRSRFLKFLIEDRGGIIAYLDETSYGVLTNGSIGPLIARNEDDARQIINYFLSTGPAKIITSAEEGNLIMAFSPKKIHTCLKMRYGQPLQTKPSCVYAYHSFATS